MFKNKDLSKYKNIKKRKSVFSKKSLKDLQTYLNAFDYKEFLALYLPSNYNEVKIIIKPLPFINENRDDIGGIYLPFSKHLSKNIKLNCRMNIEKVCPICTNSSIKKYDFVIFPAYIIKHSQNSYSEKQIKLLEIQLTDWNKYIEPFIEDFYKEDLILHITLKKDKYFHKTLFSTENYKLEELTEELVLNKSFIYENISNYLYDPKCYVKDFSLETNKHNIIIKDISF